MSLRSPAGLTGVAALEFCDGDRPIGRLSLEGVGQPDLQVVDALARLQLAARRRGWSIRVCDANPELRQLLDLVGLLEEIPTVEPDSD